MVELDMAKFSLDFSKLSLSSDQDKSVLKKQIINQSITQRTVKHDSYFTEDHAGIVGKLDNVDTTTFSIKDVAFNKMNAKLEKLKVLYTELAKITYNYSSITYENKEGENVTRYGILVDNNLKSSFTEFNKVLDNSTGSVFSLKSVNSAASSNRSNASKKLNKKEKLVEKELLKCENKFMHLAELVVLKKALGELKNTNTVLIEFFERDGANRIMLNKDTGLFELHTILLYKVSNTNDVVIIDPNNSDFSKHIGLGINKALKEICTDFSAVNLRLPATNKLKIYEGEKDNIGPNFDQYRDCIDIAVKLAFAIQKNDRLDALDTNKSTLLQDNSGNYKVSEWLPVVEISNKIDLNRHLIYQECFSVARIQQASESIHRKGFIKFSEVFYNKFNGVEGDFEPYIKEETMEEEFKKLFKKIIDTNPNGDYDNIFSKGVILSELQQFQLHFKESMENNIDSMDQELVGFYTEISEAI